LPTSEGIGYTHRVKLSLPQALALVAAAALVCVGVFTGHLDELVQKALLIAGGLGTTYALFVTKPGEPPPPALSLFLAVSFAGVLTACGGFGPTKTEADYAAEMGVCAAIQDTPTALACVNSVDCKYGRPECVR
jgi:hypothetical protein